METGAGRTDVQVTGGDVGTAGRRPRTSAGTRISTRSTARRRTIRTTRPWTGAPSRAARSRARRSSRCRLNESRLEGPGSRDATPGIRMSQPVLELVSGGKPADSRAALRELYTTVRRNRVRPLPVHAAAIATKAEDAMQDVFAKALTHWQRVPQRGVAAHLADPHRDPPLPQRAARRARPLAPAVRARDAGARRRARRAAAVRGSRGRAQAARPSSTSRRSRRRFTTSSTR